jgi:hypothetical protein
MPLLRNLTFEEVRFLRICIEFAASNLTKYLKTKRIYANIAFKYDFSNEIKLNFTQMVIEGDLEG